MALIFIYLLASIAAAFYILKWINYKASDLDSFTACQRYVIKVAFWVICPTYPLLILVAAVNKLVKKT